MYDPAPQRGPLNSTEKWIGAIFLVVVLGLFAAEIYHDYKPVKLSALLVVLFWIPLLALHEAGPGEHSYRTAIHRLGQDPYMIGLLTRAVTGWLLGRGDLALDDAGRALAFAEASGNKLNEAVANAWVAKLQKLRRDPAALAATSERATQLCEQYGFTMWLGACRALSGFMAPRLRRRGCAR